MAHLQEGCPNYTQRSNLSAIPLKKVKFKHKNQKAVMGKLLSKSNFR
jgi:hypothetical protein